MADFQRPDADTLIANFTDQDEGTTDIFRAVSEPAPDDSAYIKSPDDPADEVYVCHLSEPASLDFEFRVMRMRTAAAAADGPALSFRQELRQGYVDEDTQGTLIAEQERTGVTSQAFVTSQYNLTPEEIATITDYADLFYRFVVSLD